jgi:hypothetical protein
LYLYKNKIVFKFLKYGATKKTINISPTPLLLLTGIRDPGWVNKDPELEFLNSLWGLGTGEE